MFTVPTRLPHRYLRIGRALRACFSVPEELRRPSWRYLVLAGALVSLELIRITQFGGPDLLYERTANGEMVFLRLYSGPVVLIPLGVIAATAGRRVGMWVALLVALFYLELPTSRAGDFGGLEFGPPRWWEAFVGFKNAVRAKWAWRWFFQITVPTFAWPMLTAWLVGTLGESQRRAKRQALHDPLTNLLNRRGFIERLEYDLRRRTPLLAVVYLDLDGFKRINDSQGHGAGDDALRMVAGVLRTAVGDEGRIARFGGDEFALLLYGYDDYVRATMQGALQSIGAGARERGWELDASVGIVNARSTPGADAVTHNIPARATELLQAADALMYLVKRDGKGGVRFAAAA